MGWDWTASLMLFAFDGAAAEKKVVDPNLASPSLVSMLLPFAVLMAAFYFLILLPDSRRQKKKQEELARIKKGDEILTTCGIIGVVANIKDERIVLKVDEARGVTIEFAKSSVSQILKAKGEGTAAG